MGYLPLYIDASYLKVLVIGGGSIGTRRAITFFEKGAMVTVLADRFTDELKNRQNDRLRLFETTIKNINDIEDLIKRNDLIVIATNNEELNKTAYEISIKYNKLVNNAANAKQGNVVLPFRSNIWGEIEVSVTSLGASGIAARRALEKIVAILNNDIELKTLFTSMKRFKEYIKKNIKDASLRYKLYFMVENDKDFEKFVKEGNEEKAYERALDIAKSYLNIN
ncbi:MAG: precorrin-2 dehydrogenase/sirohydrochlorin ferrochelatase family protein [Caldisphaera sp.]|jgi:precorrin-2 dehydrogenase/sirohydrochlorin ferrochelatase|nr:MAG: hypothetical protein C0201_03300 [Caldisphaera sp.]